MKLSYLAIAALGATLAVAISAALVPRDSELALIRFKDKEFDEARRAYKELWDNGERSIAVVVPLTKIYLQYGEVDRAVGLMEEFVRRNPENVEARVQLGKYYQYAQRPHAYIENLEVVSSLRPTEDQLRELSDSFNFIARYDKQIGVLTSLIELYPARPDDFLRLAYLQASQRLFQDALETLSGLEQRYPDAVDDDTKQLELSLALDSGRLEQALHSAVEWLARNPEATSVLATVRVFRFKGQTLHALRLLTPFSVLAESDPLVLDQLIELQIAHGQRMEAFARLKRMLQDDRLPRLLHSSMIQLSIDQKEGDIAFQVARQTDIRELPEWLLAELAEAAMDSGRSRFAQGMVETLGQDFLASRPVLGAELALLREDRAWTRRWVTRAQRFSALSQFQEVRLARVLVRLGEIERAMDLLESVAASRDPSDFIVADLAQLYLEAGQVERGLEFLEEIKKRRPSPRVVASWALMASAAGRPDAVARWVGSLDQDSIRPEWLIDLYFIASDREQFELALRCAEWLSRVRGSSEDQVLLARGLTSVGRPDQALEVIRPLLPGEADIIQAYEDALILAWKQRLDVGSELEDHWILALGGVDLTQKRREEIVHGLIDVGGDLAVYPELADLARRSPDPWLYPYVEVSLRLDRQEQLIEFLSEELERDDLSFDVREPHLQLLLAHGGPEPARLYLRRFADDAGDKWSPSYQDALSKLKLYGELVDFLVERASRPDIGPEEKRATAFKLLELGRKGSAEDLFLDLAQLAAPDSASTSQILYLWGPRPSKEHLDWLEQRARVSSGRDLVGWLNHLINAGDPQRVVELIRDRLPAPGQNQALRDTYLKALVEVRRYDEAGDVLREEIALAEKPSRLRRLSRLGLETGQVEEAENGFLRLLSILPDDGESLKWAGQLAYTRAAYSEAERFLRRAVDVGLHDYETFFYLGEIFHRNRDKEGAEFYSQAVLRSLESSPPDDRFAAERIRAQTLNRLGNLEESLFIFARLRAERPYDQDLRADLVAILVEHRRFDEARRMLWEKSDRSTHETTIRTLPPREIRRFESPRPRPVHPEAVHFDATHTERGAELALIWPDEVGFESVTRGRELLFRFEKPLLVSGSDADRLSRDGLFVSSGYDTLLVTTANESDYRVEKRGRRIIIHVRHRIDSGPSSEEENRPAQVRLELLRAQVYADDGQLPRALEMMDDLEERNPGNPQVLAYRAALENRINRPRRALKLTEAALNASPNNEDIIELHQELVDARRPVVGLDAESINVQDGQRELRLRTRGNASLTESLRVDLELEQNWVEIPSVLRNDGRTSSFNGTRQRGRFALDFETETGTSYWASFFIGDKSGPGFGLGIQRPDLHGRTSVLWNYRRPYWGFVQGLANGMTRDRIEAGREQRIGSRAIALLKGAYNSYGTEGLDAAATSLSLETSFMYAVLEEHLFVMYGIEAEYERSRESLQDSLGNEFFPVPLESREVHSLDLAFQKRFSEMVSADGFAGYSWDRLGGSGPFVGGNLRFDVWRRLQGRFWIDRRLNSVNTGQRETRVGVFLGWKY